MAAKPSLLNIIYITMYLFITNRHRVELPKNTIKIFDTNVRWQSEGKYLGMVLDKRLTHKKHIDFVIGKANTGIRTLYPMLCRKSRLHQQNKSTNSQFAPS